MTVLGVRYAYIGYLNRRHDMSERYAGTAIVPTNYNLYAADRDARQAENPAAALRHTIHPT